MRVENMACDHVGSFQRNAFMIIATIIIVFILREVLCWFLKTNDSVRCSDILAYLEAQSNQS